MSVYKDEKTGKWYALAWYHDWKGEGRQKCKRGFETKKEAQEWERTFLQQNAADTFSISLSAYASSETIAEVSAEMKQYMLVMYNNVTETADEAMNNIACEI